MSPSRDEKTNRNYAIKAMGICSRVAKSYGHNSPHTVPPLAVVEHLINRKTSIARNTWKQYKNALRCHFENLLADTPEKVLAEDLQSAINMLDSQTSEGTMKYGTRTSSRKQKGIKKEDYLKLASYLAEKVGVHVNARALMTWIQATRLVGLRPSEWEYASIIHIDGNPVLHVQNAKATNGRGLGESRTLELSRLNQDEVDQIRDMVDMIEGFMQEVDFETLQKNITYYMNYACRQCFGKRSQYPTLYSFRHQFSANAKFSGLSKAEIAALMGHGSDETAATHYAKKRSGDSAVKVRPLASDVQRVRAKAKGFALKKNQPEG